MAGEFGDVSNVVSLHGGRSTADAIAINFSAFTPVRYSTYDLVTKTVAFCKR